VRATVASNTSPGGFYPQAFDIITPIYSAKSNLYGDYQNTLMVGSNAISDDRLITPIKDALPATKAWVEALGIIQGPSTSSLLPVPIPDLAATIQTSGGDLRIQYHVSVTLGAVNAQVVGIVYVDGVQQGEASIYAQATAANTAYGEISDAIRVSAGPGTHFVAIYWNVIANTVTSIAGYRSMLVEET
jgi:hypothetical protein